MVDPLTVLTPPIRVPHVGARAVLGAIPVLTLPQWRLVVELLVKEQRSVLETQRDKAAVIQASTNLAEMLEAYLSKVADLKDVIVKQTGISLP
jgi:hypothetical protein